MRLKHKVTAAVLGGALWLGIAAQATDESASLASASGDPGAVVPANQAGSQMRSARIIFRDEQASIAGDTATVSPRTSNPPPASTSGTNAPPSTVGVAAAAKASKPGGYDAGGSTQGSSPLSQAYAQTTQAGYGCPAALQYLAQNANPEFNLVCPGYAMGHQAMTCYYLQGVCPDSAEIVIADPCPAAYKNEAWNSWHMGTGPYDPYGWCSDWGSRQGPVVPSPTPSFVGVGPSPTPGLVSLFP